MHKKIIDIIMSINAHLQQSSPLIDLHYEVMDVIPHPIRIVLALRSILCNSSILPGTTRKDILAKGLWLIQL